LLRVFALFAPAIHVAGPSVLEALTVLFHAV